MQSGKKQKIVILGDTGVGKTQLVSRILDEDNNSRPNPTIGVQFNVKHLPNNVQLNFWDTGGQQKYKSIVKIHFRSADVLVFVYDVTHRASFTNIKKWLQMSNDYVQTDKLIKILVGNKIDLRNDRQVQPNQANNYAQQNGMICVEVSAYKNQNIDLFTQKLIQSINQKNWRSHKQKNPQNEQKFQKIDININAMPPTNKNSCCC